MAERSEESGASDWGPSRPTEQPASPTPPSAWPAPPPLPARRSHWSFERLAIAALSLAVVALTVALVVAFVNDSRLDSRLNSLSNAQAQNGTQISFNQSTQWVSCQTLVTNQFIHDTGGATLRIDESHAQQIRDKCSAPNDAWVLCVFTEETKLTPGQLDAFDTATAKSIADTCKTSLSQ
jgi:hypothetical protein